MVNMVASGYKARTKAATQSGHGRIHGDVVVHVAVLVGEELVDAVRVGEDLGGLVVVLVVVVRAPGGRASHIAELGDRKRRR